jgi:hypothetical protein
LDFSPNLSFASFGSWERQKEGRPFALFLEKFQYKNAIKIFSGSDLEKVYLAGAPEVPIRVSLLLIFLARIL